MFDPMFGFLEGFQIPLPITLACACVCSYLVGQLPFAKTATAKSSKSTGGSDPRKAFG